MRNGELSMQGEGRDMGYIEKAKEEPIAVITFLVGLWGCGGEGGEGWGMRYEGRGMREDEG